MKFFPELNVKGRQNRIIIGLFAGIAVVLVCVAVYRFFFSKGKKMPIHPKTVIPATEAAKKEKNGAGTALSDNSASTLFIPLHPNETLISSLTVDVDGDTFDDQIVAVRKADSASISLVIGLYNPDSNTYTRGAEIATGITRIKTFSYTGFDVVGNHHNTIVYQGIRDDGISVMRLYLYNRKNEQSSLELIGDFQSDGTIFIQQSDRSESYELSQSRGNSFPVWVYSSDHESESASDTVNMSQIQTEYQWNEQTRKYQQTKQFRITGSRVAAKELARIQNGTVETFAEFLDGMWYKTSNEGDSIRFLHFNYAAKEIIFLYKDTEEVYSWEDSNLRRSGIYLTTANESITTMQRRFDITLTGVDQIQVHVIDDVRMIIKEAPLWDGEYKKMTIDSSIEQPAAVPAAEQFTAELTKGPSWKTVGSQSHMTFADGQYAFTGERQSDSGQYAVMTVSGAPIIQFRSSSAQQLLAPSYRMEFGRIVVPASGKKKEHEENDLDTVKLTPVIVSPDSFAEGDGTVLTLVREQSVGAKK